MTRLAQLGFRAALGVAVYLLFFLDIISIPFIPKEISDEIVPVIPFWLLVTFGSYCLGTLGWGIVTFGECPEAYEDLLKEIHEAKNDLRSKGVSVD